jgi:hypothetical protein
MPEKANQRKRVRNRGPPSGSSSSATPIGGASRNRTPAGFQQEVPDPSDDNQRARVFNTACQVDELLSKLSNRQVREVLSMLAIKRRLTVSPIPNLGSGYRFQPGSGQKTPSFGGKPRRPPPAPALHKRDPEWNRLNRERAAFIAELKKATVEDEKTRLQALAHNHEAQMRKIRDDLRARKKKQSFHPSGSGVSIFQ